MLCRIQEDIHTQIQSVTMITISFILVAFIGKAFSCDQAWMNVHGEAGASGYFVNVLAEGVHCTRLIMGLFDETVQSFTMHYEWLRGKPAVTSITYNKSVSVENSNPYACLHSASTQNIRCARVANYLCFAFRTESNCCSHSSAILWSSNKEFLYSSEFTNHTSGCSTALTLHYLIFYELKTMFLTSRSTVRINPSTPLTPATPDTPSINITSEALDKDHTSSGLIIGLTLGAVLVVIIVIVAFALWKKRKSINRATNVLGNISTSSNTRQQSKMRLDNIYNNIPILRMLPLFKKKDAGKVSNRCQSPKELQQDHDNLGEEITRTQKSEIVDISRQSNTYDVYTCIDKEYSKNLDSNLKCCQQYQCYQNNRKNSKRNDNYQNIDKEGQQFPNYKTNDQTGKVNQDYETIDQIGQQIQDHQTSELKGQQGNSHATINHDVMLSTTYTNIDQVDDKDYSTIDQQAEPTESELTNETTDKPSSQAHVMTTPYARLGNKIPCLKTPCSDLLPDEISSPTYFVLESVAELAPYSMARPISSDDKL